MKYKLYQLLLLCFVTQQSIIAVNLGNLPGGDDGGSGQNQQSGGGGTTTTTTTSTNTGANVTLNTTSNATPVLPELVFKTRIARFYFKTADKPQKFGLVAFGTANSTDRNPNWSNYRFFPLMGIGWANQAPVSSNIETALKNLSLQDWKNGLYVVPYYVLPGVGSGNVSNPYFVLTEDQLNAGNNNQESFDTYLAIYKHDWTLVVNDNITGKVGDVNGSGTLPWAAGWPVGSNNPFACLSLSVYTSDAPSGSTNGGWLGSRYLDSSSNPTALNMDFGYATSIFHVKIVDDVSTSGLPKVSIPTGTDYLNQKTSLDVAFDYVPSDNLTGFGFNATFTSASGSKTGYGLLSNVQLSSLNQVLQAEKHVALNFSLQTRTYIQGSTETEYYQANVSLYNNGTLKHSFTLDLQDGNGNSISTTNSLTALDVEYATTPNPTASDLEYIGLSNKQVVLAVSEKPAHTQHHAKHHHHPKHHAKHHPKHHHHAKPKLKHRHDNANTANFG